MFQRIFRVIWITFFKRVLNLIPTQTCLDFAENILKGFQLKRIRENWSKGIWCLFSEVVINHFSRRWTLLMCVTFILRISNKKSYLFSTTNVYLLIYKHVLYLNDKMIFFSEEILFLTKTKNSYANVIAWNWIP